MTATPSHDIEALAKKAVDADSQDLKKALYAGAEAEAIAHRMITDSRYGATYESMKPEHSKMWKAAARITDLEQALAEARGKALEEAAQCAELYNRDGPDRVSTIARQINIANAIRALNTHPDTMNDESPRQLTEGSINA